MIWLLLFFVPILIHLIAGAFGLLNAWLGVFVYVMGWSCIVALIIGPLAFLIGLVIWFILFMYRRDELA